MSDEAPQPSFPDSGRVLGIDLGDRRIGIAVSDPARTVASPLTVIQRGSAWHRDLLREVQDWEAVGIVVGLPLSLDGSEGPAARKALAETKQLGEQLRVPAITYDERLTTISAERMMTDAGLDSRKQRQVVDKIAAAIMLQAWLDSRRSESPTAMTDPR